MASWNSITAHLLNIELTPVMKEMIMESEVVVETIVRTLAAAAIPAAAEITGMLAEEITVAAVLVVTETTVEAVVTTEIIIVILKKGINSYTNLPAGRQVKNELH